MESVTERKVNKLFCVMGKFSIPTLNVYDLRGQSNMGGQGVVTTELPAGYQGAQTSQIYYKTTRTSADDGTWSTLTPGTNTHGDPSLAGNDLFGIESKLFKDMAKTNTMVIKSSIGGTNISSHLTAGANGIVSNDYYLKPGLSKIAKDGVVNYRCIWFQGYSDCTSDATANAYAANLATWASELTTVLKALVKTQTEYPLVVLESPDFADGATTEARVNTVQAAQLAFAATGRKRYSVAKPSGSILKADNIHVNGAGLLSYADNVATEIQEI